MTVVQPAVPTRAESSEAADAVPSRLATVLEIVATALEHVGLRAAATAVATELAARVPCDRVSVGFLRRGQMRVEALSHSATFDGRTALIHDLGRVMDEAAD